MKFIERFIKMNGFDKVLGSNIEKYVNFNEGLMLKGASLDQVRPVYCGFILIERDELRLSDLKKYFRVGKHLSFVVHVDRKQNTNLNRKHGIDGLAFSCFFLQFSTIQIQHLNQSRTNRSRDNDNLRFGL